MKLEGEIAIVTGAGRGIGKAIALNLAEAGADITVVARTAKEIEQTAAEIRQLGHKALAIPTDVTKEDQVKEMVEQTLSQFGKIDILVNNAGGSPHETRSLFHESEERVWDLVLSVNLKGVLLCTRAVINHMIHRRCGKVINIASTAGLIGSAGKADYSAAKGGVIAFSKALAKEVAPYQIKVNCVCPGPTASEYLLTFPEEVKQEFLRTIPLGRFGKPEEVAGMVRFLASDEGDFITGQAFAVCGGSSLRL